jgi:myo-inositol 2-dehydrogenase/D-chiro-inositol 1-dehydrogenase
MARNFRDAKAYASITDKLNDQKLDAAYICVPPFAHEEIEEKLAGQSIPFFVEKPLATNLETPSRILKVVTERNVITSVGYHFRYMNGTARDLELLGYNATRAQDGT